jgi:hypothetical protein
MEDQLPTQVSTSTAAGATGAAAVIGMWGKPLLQWFWKFFKREVKKQVLESGDSSETISLKTPFEKNLEVFGIQDGISKLLQAVLDVKGQLVLNGEQIQRGTEASKNFNVNVLRRLELVENAVLNCKKWDGKTERRSSSDAA